MYHSLQVVSSEPLLVNTNGTSIVGITSFVEAECECAARVYENQDLECRPDTCLNGGKCVQLEEGYRYGRRPS